MGSRLKRLVRARMEETSEGWQAALRHVRAGDWAWTDPDDERARAVWRDEPKNAEVAGTSKIGVDKPVKAP